MLEDEKGAQERVEARVHAYLKEALPPSENRIPEPMDPDCELAIVIPAYAESLGLLRRPLVSLAQQRNAQPSQFEVIIVVNNPPERPTRDIFTDVTEYERKIELYDAGVEDNQTTLQLLESFKTGTPPQELDDEDRELWEQVHTSGIKIHAVDKASEGKTLAPKDANVGGARDRGLAEAIERFLTQAKKNGIIGQSDADVRFDENYVRGLITEYQENPDVVGIMVDSAFEKSAELNALLPPLLDLVSDEYRRLFYGGYIPVINRMAERAEPGAEPPIRFMGAAMSSRAYEAALAGGVPHMAGGEDPAFGDALEALGKLKKTTAAKVYPQDRLSARTAADAGHGQDRIALVTSWQTSNKVAVDNPGTILAWNKVSNAMEQARSGQLDPQGLTAAFTHDGGVILNSDELELIAEVAPKASSVGELLSKSQMTPVTMKIRSWIEKTYPRIDITEAVESVVEGIFDVEPQLKGEYQAAVREETIQEDQFVSMRKRVVQTAFDALHSVVGEEPRAVLIAAFGEAKERIGLPDEVLEQLADDTTLLDALAKMATNSADADEAMKSMKATYKELDNVGESSLKQTLVKVRAMRRVLRANGLSTM